MELEKRRPPTRPVIKTDVPPYRVFNLPLFECFLVLDCRTPREVEASPSFGSAMAMPPPSNGVPFEEHAVRFLQMVENDGLWPDHWSYCVVFRGEESSEYAEKVAKTLQATLADGAKDTKNVRSEQFARVDEIWLVEHEAVARCYPFLVGVPMEDLLPTPAEVAPGLFLGSRAVTVTEDLLRNLGISHVVTNAHLTLDPALNVEQLMLGKDDLTTEDFTPVLAPVCDFIDSARRNGTAALIQFWGRSRSSILAIAWVSRHLGISPEAAAQYVKERSPRIDLNLVPFDQLRSWASPSLAN
eukprot:Sspe_Gene.58775::Locus_32261_Transcript_1_1_Confidence_1.000_Length_2124::g.58775::m.58775